MEEYKQCRVKNYSIFLDKFVILMQKSMTGKIGSNGYTNLNLKIIFSFFFLIKFL